MASKSQLQEIVSNSIRRAIATADDIGLMAEHHKRLASRGMLADLPGYRSLRLGSAVQSWCAILFVDLRESTSRAKRIGARDTFVSMHAMMPALANLVGDEGGYIVGFRGDGLFAAFGIDRSGDNTEEIDKGDAIISASSCGQAMLEAIDEVVNPELESADIPGDLTIGVGVACGRVVITRVGLFDAFELTAYGDAVNHASKLSEFAQNEVLLCRRSHHLYPQSEGGLTELILARTDPFAVAVKFPTRCLEA